MKGGGAGCVPEDYMSRLTMPVLSGGVSSCIADILQVSGYGNETDIKVDDEFEYVIHFFKHELYFICNLY